MIQSQENCLSDNHRLIHEGWGGDSDTAPVLNFFPAFKYAGIFVEKTQRVQQIRQPPTREVFFGFFRVLELRTFWLGADSLAGGSLQESLHKIAGGS